MKEPEVVARAKPTQAVLVSPQKPKPNKAIQPSLKPISMNGVVNFTWDSEACSEHISLSDKKMRCFLAEAGYCFRSAVGSLGIMGGIAYWEVQIDPKNENELKVGVVAKKSFNYNTVIYLLSDRRSVIMNTDGDAMG
jgi:hypothetical protein